MKYIVQLSLVFAASLFVSCDSFLDEPPVSDIGENGFYKNTTELEAATVAIYDGMQSIYDYEYQLTEMRSDNSRTKNSEGNFADLEKLNIAPTNNQVWQYWSLAYNVIFRANQVIKYLDVVSDPELRLQLESEARFARALFHFNMMRLFGDVPLINRVIGYDETSYFARVDAAKVLSFVIEDLKYAEANLPANMVYGRASSGAATAILAKAYLYNKQYDLAKSTIEKIIPSGSVLSSKYSLLPEYNDVFYTEGNAEVIFAVQYVNDTNSDSQSFSYDFTYLGYASGLNYPTYDLMVATGFLDDAHLEIADAQDSRLKTLFLWEPNSASGNYECAKFVSNASATTTSGNDWIVTRYADLLLMKAEAILAGAESTSNADALNALNAVRTRAGLDAIVAPLTKADLLAERRVELAFENHRLFDLIRFGEAESVLTAFGNTEEGDFAFNADDLLLPIPQTEINIYPNLGQNPGY